MATTVVYPSLRVAADSEFELNTSGLNSRGGAALVNGLTGVALDNTNSTAYATITNAAGSVTLSQTAMTWTAAEGSLPARWALTVPNTACTTGSGPWTARVDVFGPGGTSDVHLRTFWRQLLETD